MMKKKKMDRVKLSRAKNDEGRREANEICDGNRKSG